MISLSEEPARDKPSWVSRMRSVETVLDRVILVLLASLLLPLVVGPFVAVYELAADGQVAAASFVGCLFGGLALAAIRAVRRGEFGPGLLAFALAVLAVSVLVATLLPR